MHFRASLCPVTTGRGIMRIFKLMVLSGLALAGMTTAGLSAEVEGKSYLAKERFQVRARAIQVRPDEDSKVSIGGKVSADNDVVPEVDLTYFLTNELALELIAATSKHDLGHSSGLDLGSAWALPPTLTLQYHFRPQASFSPYVGAGVNYTMFYNEKSGAVPDLDVGNGFGWALQAGADYWINENWGINVDVKKIFVDVDATLANGAVRANVDVDPWVIGTGVSYRF